MFCWSSKVKSYRQVWEFWGEKEKKVCYVLYLLLSTGRLNERVMELLLLCVGRIVFELFHKTIRSERRLVSFSQLMTVLMIITNFWGSEFGLFYSGLPRQLNRDIYLRNILSKRKVYMIHFTSLQKSSSLCLFLCRLFVVEFSSSWSWIKNI